MPSGQRRMPGPGGPPPGHGPRRPAPAPVASIERYFRVLNLPPTASQDEVRKAGHGTALVKAVPFIYTLHFILTFIFVYICVYIV